VPAGPGARHVEDAVERMTEHLERAVRDLTARMR
jgi:hypothetical protein